jgi:Ala-tRNA(Pro) deacylase
MFISETVTGFLKRMRVDYDVVAHRHTGTSIATARAAHVNPEAVAKGVLMFDPEEYVLALVPASRRVNRWAVEGLLDVRSMQFADEREIPLFFGDCDTGAVPAIGAAFGLTTVVDDALLNCRDVYFEGGDHEHLVHLDGEEFAQLMAGEPHGRISI